MLNGGNGDSNYLSLLQLSLLQDLGDDILVDVGSELVFESAVGGAVQDAVSSLAVRGR
jgi:hypothetical protein